MKSMKEERGDLLVEGMANEQARLVNPVAGSVARMGLLKFFWEAGGSGHACHRGNARLWNPVPLKKSKKNISWTTFEAVGCRRGGSYCETRAGSLHK